MQTTGQLLKDLDEIAGTVTDAPVAVVFDWENMWALEDCQGYGQQTKNYIQTCYAYHRQFWQRGVNCDIVSPRADLSRYKIVVAPMLYLASSDTCANLEHYVAQGGMLYATYTLATVDHNDLCYLGGLPGGGLRKVFGILAEEIDTLYPHEKQHAVLDGVTHGLADYCEMVHLEGAKALATYEDGIYAGMAAVTENAYGKGKAIYQACRDTGSLCDTLFTKLLAEAGIPSLGLLPHGVTAHSRTDGESTYLFLENYDGQVPCTLHLENSWQDMLRGQTVDTVTLPPYGFAVLKSL